MCWAAAGWPRSRNHTPFDMRWPRKPTPVVPARNEGWARVNQFWSSGEPQPCWLKRWFGSHGTLHGNDEVGTFGWPEKTAPMFAQACTSMPCACAFSIRSCSGSNPGGGT